MPDGAFTHSWSHYYKKIRNLTNFSSAVVKLELAGIAFRKRTHAPANIIGTNTLFAVHNYTAYK